MDKSVVKREKITKKLKARFFFKEHNKTPTVHRNKENVLISIILNVIIPSWFTDGHYKKHYLKNKSVFFPKIKI